MNLMELHTLKWHGKKLNVGENDMKNNNNELLQVEINDFEAFYLNIHIVIYSI